MPHPPAAQTPDAATPSIFRPFAYVQINFWLGTARSTA